MKRNTNNGLPGEDEAEELEEENMTEEEKEQKLREEYDNKVGAGEVDIPREIYKKSHAQYKQTADYNAVMQEREKNVDVATKSGQQAGVEIPAKIGDNSKKTTARDSGLSPEGHNYKSKNDNRSEWYGYKFDTNVVQTKADKYNPNKINNDFKTPSLEFPPPKVEGKTPVATPFSHWGKGWDRGMFMGEVVRGGGVSGLGEKSDTNIFGKAKEFVGNTFNNVTSNLQKSLSYSNTAKDLISNNKLLGIEYTKKNIENVFGEIERLGNMQIQTKTAPNSPSLRGTKGGASTLVETFSKDLEAIQTSYMQTLNDTKDEYSTKLDDLMEKYDEGDEGLGKKLNELQKEFAMKNVELTNKLQDEMNDLNDKVRESMKDLEGKDTALQIAKSEKKDIGSEVLGNNNNNNNNNNSVSEIDTENENKEDNRSKGLGYGDYVENIVNNETGDKKIAHKLMNSTTSDIEGSLESGDITENEAKNLLDVMVNHTIDDLRRSNPNINDDDISKIKDYLKTTGHNMTPNDVIGLMKTETKFESIYDEKKGFNAELVNKLEGLSDTQKNLIKDNMEKGIGTKGGRCGEYTRKLLGITEGLNSLVGEFKEGRKENFIDNMPKVGGMVFFADGDNAERNGNDYMKYGHIAAVVEISDDGKKIKVRESNMDNLGENGTISERWIDLEQEENKNVHIGFYNNTPLANALDNR